MSVIDQTKTELNLCLSSLFCDTPLPETISEQVKTEARGQFIYPLICNDITALRVIQNNIQILHKGARLEEALAPFPHVILKGPAAAMFYPEPCRRPLGDIDILVLPSDFDAACGALMDFGCRYAQTNESPDRHCDFYYRGAVIELHHKFSQLNSKKQDALLDRLLYESLDKVRTATVEGIAFPTLPDLMSGITLLAHISQHLEQGLGLRQILDFCFFVKSRLTDEHFPSFSAITDRLGRTTLAVTTARIGQIFWHAYPDLQWCKSADDSLASALFDYCYSCGNFGRKLGVRNTVEMVFSFGEGNFFGNLQKRGEENFPALQKNALLRPLAGICQAGRYIALGFKRENTLSRLYQDYLASRNRIRLIRALGASRMALHDRKKL